MPEVCRRNDRPTARWVSRTRTRGGRRVTDSTVHDSSIDPPHARRHRALVRHPRVSSSSSRRRSTPNRPLFFPARARVTIDTRPVMTHHRVPSVVHPSRARGWKVRQFGTTRARASRGRGERARGEASARNFFARSPFGRRSVADRTGTAARGRSSGTAREDARNRGHGDCRWSAAIGRGTARCGR